MEVEITYGYNWPFESWMKPAPLDCEFDAKSFESYRHDRVGWNLT